MKLAHVAQAFLPAASRAVWTRNIETGLDAARTNACATSGCQ